MGVGIFTFYNSAAFYYNTERIKGLITQVKVETKGKGKRIKNFYYPVIEFISQTGEQKSFISNFGTTKKNFYKVGDKINILCKGETVMIYSFMHLWMPTIYLLLIALIIHFCNRNYIAKIK
jgi:hypothetical protein